MRSGAIVQLAAPSISSKNRRAACSFRLAMVVFLLDQIGNEVIILTIDEGKLCSIVFRLVVYQLRAERSIARVSARSANVPSSDARYSPLANKSVKHSRPSEALAVASAMRAGEGARPSSTASVAWGRTGGGATRAGASRHWLTPRGRPRTTSAAPPQSG